MSLWNPSKPLCNLWVAGRSRVFSDDQEMKALKISDLENVHR